MEILLCITGFSKPWLTSAYVYSLSLEKLLGSYSSSYMCRRAGTPDHCVSTQTHGYKVLQINTLSCQLIFPLTQTQVDIFGPFFPELH